MKIIKPNEHPAVIAADKRLKAAKDELLQVDTACADSRSKAAEADRHAIEQEALSEIGELGVRDAEKARKASDRMKADVQAMEQVRDRKRYVVKLLTDRLNTATAQATDECRVAVEKEIAKRVQAASKAFAAADEANQALLEMENTARDMGLKYPTLHIPGLRFAHAAGPGGISYEGVQDMWARHVEKAGVTQRLGVQL